MKGREKQGNVRVSGLEQKRPGKSSEMPGRLWVGLQELHPAVPSYGTQAFCGESGNLQDDSGDFRRYSGGFGKPENR